jgi:hypothetical protein
MSLDYIGSRALGTAVSAAVGYLYGAFWNINKKLAAQVFAINCLARIILEDMVGLIVDPIKYTKAHYAIKLITFPLATAATIIAFRHFNLIATFGTALIASLSLFREIALLVAFIDSDKVREKLIEEKNKEKLSARDRLIEIAKR